MNDFRSPSALNRYREIIPDWTAFLDAIQRPEPVGIRVRTGRVSEQTLISRLEAGGFRLAPVPGLPSLLQVTEAPGPVAKTVEHWLGLFHIQQSVMALPALALAPSPGDRVLDLCAAPGGKTTHLAELMEDRGPLVAVDWKEKRLRGLLANVYRLGHPNVLVVAADGRTLPTPALFDRVLVDAPCSAEGTLRRKGGRLAHRSAGFVSHITSVQEDLLRRAVRLTRPGGTIVYATCTFAPEENEAIVASVLESCPVRVEPIDLAIPHASGLEAWEGRGFDRALRDAWRIYPHQMDSGGMFMVKLRRTGKPKDEPEGWTRVPSTFPGEDPGSGATRLEAALEELREWLGGASPLLGDLSWMVRRDNIWAHTAGSWPIPSWGQVETESSRKIVSLGIRALRKGRNGRETPSNRFLSRWGHHLASDRRVELDGASLLTLLRGEELASSQLRPAGACALEWNGTIVGRGIFGRRGLTHEIPKALAARLKDLLPPDNREWGETR